MHAGTRPPTSSASLRTGAELLLAHSRMQIQPFSAVLPRTKPKQPKVCTGGRGSQGLPVTLQIPFGTVSRTHKSSTWRGRGWWTSPRLCTLLQIHTSLQVHPDRACVASPQGQAGDSWRWGGTARPWHCFSGHYIPFTVPGAGEGGGQVLGPRGVGGDEGQVDVSLGAAAELALGLLRSFPQPLQGQLVAAQVNALHCHARLISLELALRCRVAWKSTSFKHQLEDSNSLADLQAQSTSWRRATLWQIYRHTDAIGTSWET